MVTSEQIMICLVQLLLTFIPQTKSKLYSNDGEPVQFGFLRNYPKLNNSYLFYQMYLMIVISLMSSILTLLKPSTWFHILTYLLNFLLSTLVVKSGCGFRPTSPIGDSMYQSMAAIPIFTPSGIWCSSRQHNFYYWVSSYLLFI